RRPARHRLDRCDAERLVPRRRHEVVRRRVVVLELVTTAPTREAAGISNPLLLGDQLEAVDLGSDKGIDSAVVLAAHDEEEGIRMALALVGREAANRLLDALPRNQPPELKHDLRIKR